MSRELVRQSLMRDEGLRLMPYKDTTGHVSIGYGRNLDGVGISLDEARAMLENDIDRAEDAVLKAFDWAADLDPVRYGVLVMLCFNLGIRTLMTFQRTLQAMKDREWEQAALHLLNSKAASQTGQRYVRYARLLRTGEWV